LNWPENDWSKTVVFIFSEDCQEFVAKLIVGFISWLMCSRSEAIVCCLSFVYFSWKWRRRLCKLFCDYRI